MTQVTPKVKSVVCNSDLKRHKCRAGSELPIHVQAGAVQCNKCNRWFVSNGGLAVHAYSAPVN